MPRIPAEFSRFGCAFLAHVGQERGAWLRRCPWDEQAPDDPEPQAPRRRTARQVSSWRPRVAAVYAGRRGLRWPRRAGWRFPVRLGRQLRAWSAERWLAHSCARKEDREPARALPACVARSVPFGWTQAACGSRHPAGTLVGESPTRPRLWRDSWRRLGCERSRVPAVFAGLLDLPAPLSGAGESHDRRGRQLRAWSAERWLAHSCARKEDREPGRALPACVARSVPFGWTQAACGSRHPAGTLVGESPTRPRLWRDSWRWLGCGRFRVPAVFAGLLDLLAPLSGAGESHDRRGRQLRAWSAERWLGHSCARKEDREPG